MANFAGPGFSSGFARGANVVAQRRAGDIREQELAAAKQKQASDRLQKAFETSEKGAQTAFDAGIEMMSEAIQTGQATPEQIEGLSRQVMLGPESHALFLAEQRAQAKALGATDEQLELMPSPGEFVATRRAILDSTIQVNQMVGNADIGQIQIREGSDFVQRRTNRGVVDMSPEGVLSRSPIDRVQRIEQGGPGAFDADVRTDTQRGEAAEASIGQLEDAQRRILELTTLGGDVAAAPGVAGLTGFLNQQVGGAVGVVAPALSAGISQLLTGVDPQRAAQLRADLQIIVAQNLELVTGEESGRFTQQEQEITRQTVRSLPLLATADQIVGAFGTLLRVNLASESRELARQNKDQRFDMLSTEGETVQVGDAQISRTAINELDAFLIDAGITSEAVRDSVTFNLIAVQRQGVVPIR